MMNKSSCKTLLEPFSRAYYFGTERVSSRYSDAPTQQHCSFKDIKAACEEPYPDSETVFVKDMAYYLAGRLDTPQYLPANYIHTFLLRDPKKSVYSLYSMSLNKDVTGWDHFDANEVGFKELHQLYRLVTEQLGQEAVIIDADDLLKNPETIFRLYCDKVGMQFEERMLNWDNNVQDLEVFQQWMPWFEGVLTSNTFQPSATKPKSPMLLPDLPRHVQKAIDDCTPFYKEMYERRLRPNTLHIH